LGAFPSAAACFSFSAHHDLIDKGAFQLGMLREAWLVTDEGDKAERHAPMRIEDKNRCAKGK
jgi:hypothetical protein